MGFSENWLLRVYRRRNQTVARKISPMVRRIRLDNTESGAYQRGSTSTEHNTLCGYCSQAKQSDPV